MLNGIDHIVIAVPELEQAITSYIGLGFTVVRGGKHPIGTHNALIAFEDGAYIELIAFFDPNAQHHWKDKLEQGMALVDFCMQTDDLQADMQAFRQAGLGVSDPIPLSRERPDGYKLDWVLSVAGEHSGVAPFLIQDNTPREERVPRENEHANGATGIDTMTVAVNDVAAVRGWYTGVLGTDGEAISRADLNAAGVQFKFGPHTFDFVAPDGTESPLQGWLAKHGPSPYAATFTTNNAAQRGVLDTAQTLGARLTLI